MERKDRHRHEIKYVCSETQLALIQGRIQPLLSLDQHVREKGQYTIRSLYFDDVYDTALFENESGTDPREKFRNRTYNGASDKIYLELKSKVHGMTKKQSCRLTEEQCRLLMVGKVPLITSKSPFLLKKLCTQIHLRQMRPKIVVEYHRVPFVYPLSNVRVTFDKDIVSSDQVENFLSPSFRKRPVMPPGLHVLEVKFDNFFPDFIYQAMQINGLQRTAYSKYYLSRVYSLKGSVL